MTGHDEYEWNGTTYISTSLVRAHYAPIIIAFL